ncbi:MAG: zinc ABC transporter substrate-binding protein [Pseudomonadota bacterium]
MGTTYRYLLAATAAGGVMAQAVTAASALEVASSIRPVHSLTAAVMKGVGTPTLLHTDKGSPHNAALRPSQARALQNADVVFWVGPQIESFLTRPIKTVSANAQVVSLLEIDGIKTLEVRGEHDHDHAGHDDHADHTAHSDSGHDDHGHDDHDHGKKVKKTAAKDDGHDHGHGHDDHDHGKKAKKTAAKSDGHDHGHDHDDHDHGKKAKKAADDHDEHGHDDHDHGKKEAAAGHEGHGHAEGDVDAHIWLDPHNAEAAVKAIAAVLSKADAANAAAYQANAAAYIERLEAMEEALKAKLAPAAGKPFIVFHDAYQYFEKHFGLQAPEAIAVNPEVPPSAERLREIKNEIAADGITCVFAEPQFSPRVIKVVVEGTGAKASVIDPIGNELEPGADLYLELMTNLGTELADCLAGTS